MSTAREGTAARLVNWLRAGMPEGVARAEYMALVSVLHKELSAEEIDQVAEALMAEAVSYTHLDVYKRQHLDCVGPRLWSAHCGTTEFESQVTDASRRE